MSQTISAPADVFKGPTIIEGPLTIVIEWQGRHVNTPLGDPHLVHEPHWQVAENGVQKFVDAYFWREGTLNVCVKQSVIAFVKPLDAAEVQQGKVNQGA